MLLQQFRQPLCTRLLQHHLQHIGCTAVADKHTMILGDRGVEPQAVAHHVGIGNGAYALCCADIYVAADYHRGQPVGSLRHHSLIERQLQVEQGLCQPLSAFPAEHRNGCQYLATGGIRRQTAALSTGMQDNASLGCQPLVERQSTTADLSTGVCLLQQPCRTTART